VTSSVAVFEAAIYW